MLRVDVTRNVSDAASVGGKVGVGPLGVSGGVYGMWHALRSPTNGHSLFVKGGGMASTMPFVGSGTAPFLGIEAGLGYEWRGRSGPVIRAEVGGGAYAQPGTPGSSTFTPTFGISAGWTF